MTDTIRLISNPPQLIALVTRNGSQREHANVTPASAARLAALIHHHRTRSGAPYIRQTLTGPASWIATITQEEN